MRKHRIDDSDRHLWIELSKKFNQIVIDETEFSYKGANFNFMGISGEPIFEKIRKDNTFYNVFNLVLYKFLLTNEISGYITI